MTLPPEYEADFYDLLGGTREDVRAHQERIYRRVESNLIAVWKEVQRIQGNIIAGIARQLPPKRNDVI